jgi:outer membrane immunogenic protein
MSLGARDVTIWRKKVKFILPVVAAMSLAPAAHAEMFNGGYVGVTGGYEKNTVDSTKLFAEAGFPSASTDKKSVSGATLGINAGYDWKSASNFVVGGEFAATFSTSTNKQLVNLTPTTAPIAIDYKSRASFELTVRAGILAGEKTLVYARGGYANSKLKATFPGTITDPVKGNNNGWLIGAGVEQALTDKISARLEYRYFNLKGPVSRNQAIIGVAYHF